MLRVRMGLHSGVVDRLGDGFVGIDIHLAARVQGVAHGGQIVVTEPTRRLVASGFELAPLGEHRLKDFPEPERLFQVVVDGRGPDAFPPLRSAPARPTNLPVELRPLLGREAELAALREAVLGDDRRLHTITGLGGTGKTRLALAAARDLLDEHEGGVWLVPLAGVREPEALLPAVAATLGVRDDVGRLARRGDHRAHRRHAHPAGARQLRAAGHLRADDRGYCSTALPAPVRSSPASSRCGSSASACTGSTRSTSSLRWRCSPSARGASWDDFDPAAERPHIERIVERVGGMPLAIELAAARVAVLTPERAARAARSHARHARPAGRPSCGERHRSLRATLEWTHGLLGDEERVLMARLAAFAGPAPLDAVEAVADAGEEPVDALEALAVLIDASVVRRAGGPRRTACASRWRRLCATSRPESSRRQARSTRCGRRTPPTSRALAEACRFWYPGHPDEARARVSALVEEQRPALAWTREHDPTLHLRLASALGAIMYRSGRMREAEFELAHALARTPPASQEAGWAAVVRGALLVVFGRPQEARALVEQAEPVLRAGTDDVLLDHGLRGLSVVWTGLEEPARAAGAADESVALARARGDPTGLAAALGYQAWALLEAGDPERARAAIDELERLIPQARDSTLAGLLKTVHADWAMAREDWPPAARGYAECARAAQAIPDDGQTCWDVMGMLIAYAALERHELVLECDGLLGALTIATGMRHGPDPTGTAGSRRAAPRRGGRSGRAAADAAAARGAALTRDQRLTWLAGLTGAR